MILAFYDPKDYGVFDIHAWRELMGKQPEDLFTLENLLRFLARLREEATMLKLDARMVEKAYFKKNLDESQGVERQNVDACPRCGSTLAWRVAATGERYRGCTNFNGGCRWNDRSY